MAHQRVIFDDSSFAGNGRAHRFRLELHGDDQRVSAFTFHRQPNATGPWRITPDQAGAYNAYYLRDVAYRILTGQGGPTGSYSLPASGNLDITEPAMGLGSLDVSGRGPGPAALTS